MSPKGLAQYRDFIDALAQRRDTVLFDWIRARGWPQLPENVRINDLLSRLTGDDRETVAQIATEARESGIHDVLVFLQEQLDSGALKILVAGTELPNSPYDTELYWDWSARVEGTPWPEDPSSE